MGILLSDLVGNSLSMVMGNFLSDLIGNLLSGVMGNSLDIYSYSSGSQTDPTGASSGSYRAIPSLAQA